MQQLAFGKGLSRWAMGLFQQLSGLHLQRFGQFIQSPKGKIFLGSFNRAHISPVQLALCREFLLRPAARLSELAHGRSHILY